MPTGYELEPVLRTVARTTAACLGFGTAVINLYRPAWDDFHTVVVEGSEDARRLLLGQTSTAEDWALLLDGRFERRGAYVVQDFDWSQDRMATYVPPIEASEDPDRWQPDDALFVPLLSSAGACRSTTCCGSPPAWPSAARSTRCSRPSAPASATRSASTRSHRNGAVRGQPVRPGRGVGVPARIGRFGPPGDAHGPVRLV
jgi:hypothetical protein